MPVMSAFLFMISPIFPLLVLLFLDAPIAPVSNFFLFSKTSDENDFHKPKASRSSHLIIFFQLAPLYLRVPFLSNVDRRG